MEIPGITRVGTMRVVERAKLPETMRTLFSSDWIVLFPSGYGAGVSCKETAFRMAQDLDAETTHTIH